MINFQLSNYLLNISVMLLAIVSVKLVFSKNLLESILSISFFSVLIALVYLFMDGPDVAMTEIALGACLSSCVYLSILTHLPESVKTNIKQTRIISSSVVCLAFVTIMVYLGLDLPEYGSLDSPLQTHLSQYYIEHTAQDIGIKSFVAALLASYRAYDTLGETTVILLAGTSVLLLLSRKNHA